MLTGDTRLDEEPAISSDTSILQVPTPDPIVEGSPVIADETWEEFRTASIKHLKYIATFLENGVPKCLRSERTNTQALIDYYEQTATDFAPTRQLWVLEGVVYEQDPNERRSWLEEVSTHSVLNAQDMFSCH